MTRYAVGDLQGCLAPLQCLLKKVEFNQAIDQLWIVGDLINRGPESLATLRFVHSLGDSAHVVLGNHDLHLLAVAFGATHMRRQDTFADILHASDCDELIDWLRRRPLVYSDPSGDFSMSHAGIPPQWSLAEAHRYAREVEEILQGEQIKEFFSHMYGNQPDCWQDNLAGWDRYRLITNYLTRMRFCSASGQLDLDNKTDTPNKEGFLPWFAHPQRRTANDRLLFGHWASLQGRINEQHVYALDTGCVWGGHMTLMNLDTLEMHRCNCEEYKSPDL